MSYVKDTDIFDATNGGLDIITSYYPNAIKVITKTTKHFKIRESEKTASASLKQLESGIWVVTDFGGDNKPRNGIQVCQLEENISFGEACAVLGSRFGVKGAVLQVYKPIVEKRSLTANEVPNSYSFQYNETFYIPQNVYKTKNRITESLLLNEPDIEYEIEDFGIPQSLSNQDSNTIEVKEPESLLDNKNQEAAANKIIEENNENLKESKINTREKNITGNIVLTIK